MRARARSRRCSRSASVMGLASARLLARAAMAGGRWSGWWDCCARARVGVAAAATAEVRRKRRRLSMGAISVLGKFASEAIRYGQGDSVELEAVAPVHTAQLLSYLPVVGRGCWAFAELSRGAPAGGDYRRVNRLNDERRGRSGFARGRERCRAVFAFNSVAFAFGFC